MADIEYSIDADTAAVVDKINKVIGMNDKLIASFEKSDKAVDSSNKTMGKYSQQAKGVENSTKKAGRVIDNFGYQLTDLGTQFALIVGVNGGMLAIIQQGGQMVQALSPVAAAVFTVGGALAGYLLPELINSDNAADDLEKTLAALSETVITNEQGVNALSNSFAKLAKESSNIARAQLSLSITEATKAINLSQDAARGLIGDFDTLFNGFDVVATPKTIQALNETLERTGLTVNELIESNDLYATGLTQLASFSQELSKELGVTTDESVRLIKAVSDFDSNKGPEALNVLAETITDISLNSKNATPEMQSLAVEVNKLSLTSANSQKVLVLLEKAMGDLEGTVSSSSEEIVEARSNIEKFADALRVQADTVGLSAVKTLEYQKSLALQKAAQADASAETISSINASYEKIIANAKETESENAKTKAKQEAAKADRDAAKAQQERAKAAATLSQIDPAIGVGYEAESQFKNLNAAREADLISEQQYQMRKLEITQNAEQQIMQIAEERYAAQSAANTFLIDSLNSLESSASSAFSSFIVGASTATELVQSLASTVLNQAIGALVQMGIQQVKNQVIGQSAQAASAATAAATGTAIAAAYAPAASLVSLASFGANAAPAAAGIASTSALTQSIAVAGFEQGGTFGGGMMQMGEGNSPEVMSTSAGLFAVPGDKGRMFNQEQLSQIGGSGSVNVTSVINNYASSASVDTRTSKQEDGSVIIETIVTDIRTGNGPVSSAMNQAYPALTRKTK